MEVSKRKKIEAVLFKKAYFGIKPKLREVKNFFLGSSFFDMGRVARMVYLLKVNNKNTETRCKLCSKLTIRTPERHNWCHSGVFIVNFKHISHIVLVFQFLINITYNIIASWAPASRPVVGFVT